MKNCSIKLELRSCDAKFNLTVRGDDIPEALDRLTSNLRAANLLGDSELGQAHSLALDLSDALRQVRALEDQSAGALECLRAGQPDRAAIVLACAYCGALNGYRGPLPPPVPKTHSIR